MKVYVVTAIIPYAGVFRTSVYASKKSAEDYLRGQFPDMKKDLDNGDLYSCEKDKTTWLLLISEVEVQ